MNRYPLWKYLLLAVVLVVGVLYALPNIYGDDPAVQVSTELGADEALLEQVDRLLEQENIAPKAIELTETSVMARFANTEIQSRAADVLKTRLGGNFTVALNLAPATPDWLRSLGADPMVLGLDLQGGVHFLMEVDMRTAMKQQKDRYVDDIRTTLRDARIRYRTIRPHGEGVTAQLRSDEDRQEARSEIADQMPELILTNRNEGDQLFLDAVVSPLRMQEFKDTALEQNITTLRNRVNQIGVAEPVVQQQGAERIVVQLPGVQDTGAAKRLLGGTATLEYRAVNMVDDPFEAQQSGRVPPGFKLYDFNGQPVLLSNSLIVSGEQLIDAMSGLDMETGQPQVSVTLDGVGANRMLDFTRENVNNDMAVVYVEHIPVEIEGEDGETKFTTRRDERVISVAKINDVFGKRFRTTGLDSREEARSLALQLRSGALAAPVVIIEERTVGPSLGQDNIDAGFKSVMIGFAAVLVFMLVYYRLFGLVANIALTANLVLVIALLSLFGATLTLPGIAGIVLTVGMAVDANVLIFERIREEIRNGNSMHASIRAGYEKAFSTIADANVTTLIAAIVLFAFGTGPIKGFAVTLSLGIITSMFTAIMGTRGIVNLIYGRRARLTKLSI